MSEQQHILPEIVTVADIASVCSCTKSTVYRRIKSIPALRWMDGKPRMWQREQVMRVLIHFQVFSETGSRVRRAFGKPE